MSGAPAPPAELLGTAVAARAAGDTDAARAAYLAAFAQARQADDLSVMMQAALGLAAGHQFGRHAGLVPALLHEAYSRAEGADRTRLAVALARMWVYGNDPDRALPFAVEAEAEAESSGDPVLLAEALDARLLVSWGPDDLAERVRITARLDAVVAHLSDVEARMSAHLWRMTTALEVLDAATLQRQVRALETLAEDTGSARIRFFAASRAGMRAVLQDELPLARTMLELTARAGAEAGEPDIDAIVHTLAAAIARQAGDVAAIAAEAPGFEAFGVGEGVPSVAAEAAALWLAAGEPDRARVLLDQLAGAEFATIARDVDWLFTVSMLTEVAAGTGHRELAAAGVRLLEPYAGRGVVNAGAVAFIGVVDDFLRMGCAALGRDADAERWAGSAAVCYQRMNARWWLRRLDVAPSAPAGAPRTVYLCPVTGDAWRIGPDRATVSIRDVKGLHYIRQLLRRPGVDVSALELSERAAGQPSVVQAGLGELVDRQALAAYRRRLADLDAELDEAEEWSDEGRLARARAEREALVDHLAAAAGLHGRQRLVGGTAERARVAVRKAIAAAIERIEGHDAALARLLRDTIRTGVTCRYDPDPGRPVDWILDPP